jgi:alpha-tubulin suppressor-like RCC1 family protein
MASVGIGAMRFLACGAAATLAVACGARGGLNVEPDQAPSFVVPTRMHTSLAVGPFSACALSGASGNVACWGLGTRSELGDGLMKSHAVPTVIPNFGATVALSSGLAGDVGQVAGYGTRTCALRSNGEVNCWGSNVFGYSIQPETTEERSSPTRIDGFGPAVAIASADSYACALDHRGVVWCWGYWLGVQHRSPVPLSVDHVTEISAISAPICALREDGSVWCWGLDDAAVLKDPSITLSQVVGIDHATHIAAGFEVACALREDGKVLCFGRDTSGLFDGRSERTAVVPPREMVGAPPLRSIFLNFGHLCGLDASANAYCWGERSLLPSPQETTLLGSDLAHAVHVPKLNNALEIRIGENGGCVRYRDHSISCWGANQFGQLGRGTVSDFGELGPVIQLP